MMRGAFIVIMRINIIHPSRSRPEQAAATAKAWLSSAKDMVNVDYYISLDKDDPTHDRYCELFHPIAMKTVNENRSAIDAINNAARWARCHGAELFIIVSDDFNTPPFHWDAMLLEALEGKEDFLVKTQDGCQPWIITLPIMDRKYYERFGYVYNPDYYHMFADTEMTHVGHLLGKVITLDMVIKHNHYTQRNGQPKDAINEKNDKTWAQGEKLYIERFLRNFDLPNEQIISNPYIHPSHLGWMKSKGLRYV